LAVIGGGALWLGRTPKSEPVEAGAVEAELS